MIHKKHKIQYAAKYVCFSVFCYLIEYDPYILYLELLFDIYLCSICIFLGWDIFYTPGPLVKFMMAAIIANVN